MTVLSKPFDLIENRNSLYFNKYAYKLTIEWPAKTSVTILRHPDSIESRIHHYRDKIIIYTNSVNLVNEFHTFYEKNENCSSFIIAKVNPKIPNKLFFKKKPNYKFRTFMSGRKVKYDEYVSMFNFIEQRPKSFKYNSGLSSRMTTACKQQRDMYSYTSDYIEYNDESYLTFLQLICPNLLGKTFNLEKK